jgi:hypothetical protein
MCGLIRRVRGVSGSFVVGGIVGNGPTLAAPGWGTRRRKTIDDNGVLNDAAGAADATRAILRTSWAAKRSESTFAYFANSTSFSMLQAKVDSIPIA